MRSVLLLSAIVALGACAANRTAEPSPVVPQTMRVSTTSISSISNVEANIVSIPYSIDRVWSVLPSVYELLSIPIGTFDMPGRTMGNTGLKLRRQLGKVPLSRYLDCGSGQAVASADAYDVYMSILSKVSADANGGTTLATTIEAQARPGSLSGQYFSCASKGVLERAIADQVKLKGP
jgi:hypothetical protein